MKYLSLLLAIVILLLGRPNDAFSQVYLEKAQEQVVKTQPQGSDNKQYHTLLRDNGIPAFTYVNEQPVAHLTLTGDTGHYYDRNYESWKFIPWEQGHELTLDAMKNYHRGHLRDLTQAEAMLYYLEVDTVYDWLSCTYGIGNDALANRFLQTTRNETLKKGGTYWLHTESQIDSLPDGMYTAYPSYPVKDCNGCTDLVGGVLTIRKTSGSTNVATSGGGKKSGNASSSDDGDSSSAGTGDEFDLNGALLQKILEEIKNCKDSLAALKRDVNDLKNNPSVVQGYQDEHDLWSECLDSLCARMARDTIDYAKEIQTIKDELSDMNDRLGKIESRLARIEAKLFQEPQFMVGINIGLLPEAAIDYNKKSLAFSADFAYFLADSGFLSKVGPSISIGGGPYKATVPSLMEPTDNSLGGFNSKTLDGYFLNAAIGLSVRPIEWLTFSFRYGKEYYEISQSKAEVNYDQSSGQGQDASLPGNMFDASREADLLQGGLAFKLTDHAGIGFGLNFTNSSEGWDYDFKKLNVAEKMTRPHGKFFFRSVMIGFKGYF